jgi:hypothetical protein
VWVVFSQTKWTTLKGPSILSCYVLEDEGYENSYLRAGMLCSDVVGDRGIVRSNELAHTDVARRKHRGLLRQRVRFLSPKGLCLVGVPQ